MPALLTLNVSLTAVAPIAWQTKAKTKGLETLIIVKGNVVSPAL